MFDQVIFLFNLIFIVAFRLKMENNSVNGNNHGALSNNDSIINVEGQENLSSGLLEGSDMGDETDLETMRKKINEMEEEAEKLKQMQLEVERQMQVPSTPGTRKLLQH
jgi:hypothetical protein